jgi:peptidoglycan hydrolase-like protein with peptidoglycan-binding domain
MEMLSGTGMSRRSAFKVLGAAAGTAVGMTAVTGNAAAAAQGPFRPPPDSAAKPPKTSTEPEQLRGDAARFTANFAGPGFLGPLVDEWVLHAQQWVNTVYRDVPGFTPAPETGRTGWPTMFALTRALQIELGLRGDQLSDNFGPTTMSLLTSNFGDIAPGDPENVVRIVQCAQYCKGYWGDQLSGVYSDTTKNAVLEMRRNMGFTDDRSSLSPKEFKALLTMDAYVMVENGSTLVRSVQQWMNRTYYNQSWFFIIPADGHASRDVSKAMIWALQAELAVPGANGNFGPATRTALRSRPALTVGAADSGASTFVHLFQAGMIFNRYEVAFDGMYSATVRDQVTSFQSFVALPVNGTGDFPTWCSLLVSNGDTDRRGAACDCVTEITPARGTALFQAGYRVAGRYLTNVPGTSLDKNIKPGELDTIFAAGMRVFPIYQTSGLSADYFTEQQGGRDASLATAAASGYGFERGTIVYFAVDFDALGTDITNNVIPYFQGIARAMDYYGNPYRAGVYAPRNACTQLFDRGLAVTSFVSDMSTGFSGNLGFPMPRNWAYDQIITITTGSGAGAIEIDNNIYSGRDPGQSRVTARPTPDTRLDTYFDNGLRPTLSQNLVAYSKTVPSNTIGLIHSVDDAIDVVVTYDELITNLSRSFGVRKALIQSEVFWEYWKQTPADSVADGLVIQWYAYKVAYEAWEQFPVGPPPTPPLVVHEDASTGIAQIFATTAIAARNWAMDAGLIPGNRLNAGDWHVVFSIWNSLHDDGNYNIATVPLVLFQGATTVGVQGLRLDYTADELRRIFARYNGTGPGADQYGGELYGVYQIFEALNATRR